MSAHLASWQAEVDQLWSQFESLRKDDFLAAMALLAQRDPNGGGQGAFELASAHDALNRESAAVGLYRQSLQRTLPEATRRQAAIQLASSLRVVGELSESIALLEREAAISDGLTDAANAFLCLSLIDADRSAEAAARALLSLSKHLPSYRKSVANYASAALESVSRPHGPES